MASAGAAAQASTTTIARTRKDLMTSLREMEYRGLRR
jgi:hypothetical protein